MTTLLEKIEQEAKGLSRTEKERLAFELMAALENMPLSEVDQAWIEEAERRWDDFVSGRTKGIPVKEVFENIRKGYTSSPSCT